jgi:ABC-2 type transport system permease protein
MRGLLRLTWLEIKIFVREPLGVVGSVAIPVLVFVVLSRLFGSRVGRAGNVPRFASDDLPILAAILIAVSSVLSLVTIVAIYREGGILKRLRATPLQPHTILTAQVLVKLVFTALTLGLMILAGRQYYPIGADVPLLSFAAALLFTTVTLASLGFLIASVVPTARFAQPAGAVIVYPMLGVCGLFVPLAALPPTARALAAVNPFTYAVSLLRGVWQGEGWAAHAGDVLTLGLMFVVFTAVSTKVFRWE